MDGACFSVVGHPLWGQRQHGRIVIYVGRPYKQDGLWVFPFQIEGLEGSGDIRQAVSESSFGALVSAIQGIRFSLDNEVCDFDIGGAPAWLAVPYAVYAIYEDVRLEMERMLFSIKERYGSSEGLVKSENVAAFEIQGEKVPRLCAEVLRLPDGLGDAFQISISDPVQYEDGHWAVLTEAEGPNVSEIRRHSAPTPFQAIVAGLGALRAFSESLPAGYALSGTITPYICLPWHMPIESGSEAVLIASHYIRKRRRLEYRDAEARNAGGR